MQSYSIIRDSLCLIVRTQQLRRCQLMGKYLLFALVSFCFCFFMPFFPFVTFFDGVIRIAQRAQHTFCMSGSGFMGDYRNFESFNSFANRPQSLNHGHSTQHCNVCCALKLNVITDTNNIEFPYF